MEVVSPAGSFRTPRRRKDRHGRRQNGVLVPAILPASRSRREKFDREILAILTRMKARYPEIGEIEFGVEDVPPSTPAPWEDFDVCLARSFPRDRTRGLANRIVVYRRPVMQRCGPEGCYPLLRLLLAYRISELLTVDPEELLAIG